MYEYVDKYTNNKEFGYDLHFYICLYEYYYIKYYNDDIFGKNSKSYRYARRYLHL